MGCTAATRVSGGYRASMIAYPFIRRFRWQRHLWQTFAGSAKERGLDPSQGALLEKIARADKMKHPLLLLTSLKAFDEHVGRYAHRVDRGVAEADQPMLKTIAEIRRKLGFDRPAPGQPVYSTREIQAGQSIMLWPVKGGPRGFCSCFVIHVDEHAITVVPSIKEEDKHLSALGEGDKVKVRFWREGDTEYRFRSQVVETMPETTTLKIDILSISSISRSATSSGWKPISRLLCSRSPSRTPTDCQLRRKRWTNPPLSKLRWSTSAPADLAL